jgi:L-ascorbate metabolism protein UlaG (beta-lactamase superfamily)
VQVHGATALEGLVMATGERLSRRALLLGGASAMAVPLSGACSLSRGGLPPCPAVPQPPPARLTATFFGTTSILFRGPEGAILSDGFVTRVPRLALAGPIASDRTRVAATWKRLGEPEIAAVFTGHSHYDHAMDAPTFAELTRATLVGSRSTCNLGRIARLPESQIKEVRSGESVRYGGFELTFLPSLHGRGDLAPGTIDDPFTTPAPVTAWKTGTVWSVFVRRGQRTLLVHGSAGYVPGALQGHRADVVYLGIGRLSRRVESYWNEVVVATGARRVIVVHWDDFFRSLDEPLRPMRGFARTMRALRRLAGSRVELVVPCPWEPADPFAGL